MTKIKFCGLSSVRDIEIANEQKPEYVGFVFVKKSSRYVTREEAAYLKQRLDSGIYAVGVFMNESLENIAELANAGIIDWIQLHGNEGNDEIIELRNYIDKPIIQAFLIKTKEDIRAANASIADYILLDSGAGTGKTFDWKLLENIKRPYFLAGGLTVDNVEEAIERGKPYAVDVSSGIEMDGKKEEKKMVDFVKAVRKERQL